MSEFKFKFLDSYTKEDKDIYFGREKEAEELYKLAFRAKLILLYGPMGVGKSSLIQCGLANKFDTKGWMALFIRKNEDINVSFEDTIKREIHRVDKTLELTNDIEEDLNTLYLCHFKTIYLIFDQFEEIFVFGKEEERKKFFETLRVLYRSKLNIKIILSMREDFIANLSNYESILPSLFEFRLRVERMNRKELVEVILGTCSKAGVELENETIADKIIENLRDKKEGVELTYLQVYIDRLYKEAVKNKKEKPVFNAEVINGVGKIDDVLGDFLDEVLGEIDKKIGKEITLKVLFELVTDDNTKRSSLTEEVIEKLKSKGITETDFNLCIEELNKKRVIRLES